MTIQNIARLAKFCMLAVLVSTIAVSGVFGQDNGNCGTEKNPCVGTTGPTGPQGPQGVPGPVNFVSFTGVTDASGNAGVSFPMVPSAAKPVLTCYITNALTPPVAWLLVSDGKSTTNPTFCGLVLGSNGVWSAGLLSAPAGWFYYMVVIW